MSDEANQRLAAIKLEHQTNTLARHLNQHCPPGTGFILFVVQLGEGNVNTAMATSLDSVSTKRAILNYVESMT